MKKKLPKSVQVFGRKIPIKLVPKEELNSYIQGAEGIWDTYTRTIYINKEAPLIVQKYYIYHEMGHAIKTFTGLDQILNPELQEIIVQSYATLIEDILKQHKIFE
jgi:Zn-dependent peptidase ImmA (M78 family)